MSKYVQQMIQAILEGNLKKSEAMLKRGVELRFEAMVNEGHLTEGDKYKVTFKYDDNDKSENHGSKTFNSQPEADAALSTWEKKGKGHHGVISNVTLDEQVNESKDKIKCPECDGKGEHEDLYSAKNNDNPVECSHCGGSGYVENKNSHLPVKESVKNKMLKASEHDEDEEAEYEDAKTDWKHTLDPVKDKEKADKKVKESTNEYEAQTYNHWVGHSKGKRTIFPHPKGQIPTQDTHPEHDEGIAGPYKTKKEAFNAAQGKNKVRESDEVKQDVLNELNASTLANYIGHATVKHSEHSRKIGSKIEKGYEDRSEFHKDVDKSAKRVGGISKAAFKLAKKVRNGEKK